MLSLLKYKLNHSPNNKRESIMIIDMLNYFAIFWSIANNYLLAFDIFGGPSISCNFMAMYYGSTTVVRFTICALTMFINYTENAESQPSKKKHAKKFWKTILKFNKLTMKSMIVIMCYALRMIQGSCTSESSYLIASFVVLITGITCMTKCIAKYSSYRVVYYMKNLFTFGIATFTFIQFVSFYTEPDMPAVDLLYFISVCDFYSEGSELCRGRCNDEDADLKANEKLAKELERSGHSRESILQATSKNYHYDSDDEDSDDDRDVEAGSGKPSMVAVELNPMNQRQIR